MRAREKFSLPARLLKPAAFAIIFSFAAAHADPRDPFPIGYSMAPQGAIVDPEGATGREPWAPAALYRDSSRLGFAAAAHSYHGGGSAARFAAGGLWLFGPLAGKLSMAHLDALDVYYEQDAGLSIGHCRKRLSFSVDARLRRIGLYGTGDSRTSVSAGAAACLRTGKANADITVNGLTLIGAGAPGAETPLSATVRICAVRNRYGTQGAIAIITPSDEAPLRLAVAQEYRIGSVFAVSASIATNPATIGFGVTVDKSPLCGGAAAANHPELGWSSGFAADWRGR
jgi:hypothetical protein